MIEEARARWQLGRRGESLAAAYLSRQGYRVVARNVRTHGGEIDLVAEDGPTLCFVEVRTARRGSVPAEETIGAEKQRRVVRAARAYLQRYPLCGERPVRFDCVVIRWDRHRPRLEIWPWALMFAAARRMGRRAPGQGGAAWHPASIRLIRGAFLAADDRSMLGRPQVTR